MIKCERWLHCSLGYKKYMYTYIFIYALMYKWEEHWTFQVCGPVCRVNVTGVQFPVLKHGWFYSRLPPDMRQRKWRAGENEWAWGQACSCRAVGKSHLLSPQLVLVTHGWRGRGGGKAAQIRKSWHGERKLRGARPSSQIFLPLFLSLLSFLIPLVLVSFPPPRLPPFSSVSFSGSFPLHKSA